MEKAAEHTLIPKTLIIHQLQALAVELKRTPTMRDVDDAARLGKCARAEVIKRAFGSFRDALRAALLPLDTMQEFSEKQLLSQLRDLSESLGRPLLKRDVSVAAANKTCARVATFERAFGSVSNAFVKAGVQSYYRYSENELITQYRALSREAGRPARIFEIERAAAKGQGAGYHIYKKLWGGLTEVRRAAGLLRGASKRYSRQELIDQLKSMGRKLGRAPTADDIRAAAARGETAALKTFRVYFGGHNNALRDAGFGFNKTASFSRGRLIQDLQRLAQKLGRRPSQSDVNRASQAGLCACAATYAHYFGGFIGALEAARLDRTPGGAGPEWRDGKPIKYSRSEILERLRDLGRELGRPPTSSDIEQASSRPGYPSIGVIVRRFGRFRSALEEAGFDPKSERKQRTCNRLIEQLRELTRVLRRIPTSADLAAAKGRCSTPMTFVRNFGSMVQARKAARLDEVLKEIGATERAPRVREKFKRDALIDHLRALAHRLGRPPSSRDVRRACRESGGPGEKPFLREFGSIRAARKAAGIDTGQEQWP